MGRRAIAILLLVGGLLLLLVVFGFFALQGSQPPGETTQTQAQNGEGTPGAALTPGAEGTAAPGTALEGTPGALVEVVVSLQTVPRGWRMTEAELTTDLRRAELVGDNVITNIEDAVGLFARTDIFQGQTLTKDLLVKDPTLEGVEEFGPSSLIPEGYIAYAIPMDRLSSVGYGIAAGDLVDVLLTFQIYEIDPEFQTILENSAVFYVEGEPNEEGEAELSILVLDPFGRFETLPNGDQTLIGPSENQRPLKVSMLLQAAKVVQVGPYVPPEAPAVPTVTPTPNPEATATPEAGAIPTPTPAPPDVALVALSPQQQLLLKYGVEANADVDFALRSVEDGQIFGVENVDLNYILSRFNVDIPIDFEYSAETIIIEVTVTPTPSGEE